MLISPTPLCALLTAGLSQHAPPPWQSQPSSSTQQSTGADEPTSSTQQSTREIEEEGHPLAAWEAALEGESGHDANFTANLGEGGVVGSIVSHTASGSVGEETDSQEAEKEDLRDSSISCAPPPMPQLSHRNDKAQSSTSVWREQLMQVRTLSNSFLHALLCCASILNS